MRKSWMMEAILGAAMSQGVKSENNLTPNPSDPDKPKKTNKVKKIKRKRERQARRHNRKK